ncbi:MAG: hypothetical protein LC753_01010 [Acidobacteria bacterium]|nr:hypothetical protein [Acidobacteriota bacterium]
MESRAKLLGHPIHPMLIVLPLGLFIAAVVFDALYMWRGSPTFATVAYWNIAAGIVGGLLAAVFGLVDVAVLDDERRHALRRLDREPQADLRAEVVALVIGSVAGWLGGELVDRLGVGVDDGAHLDAPSSLSGRPARLK